MAPGGGSVPDLSRFQLGPGDCVLMVTDGVAGTGGDVWLRERLRSFDGASPKDIARILIDESTRRGGGEDDRTAILLRMDKREDKR